MINELKKFLDTIEIFLADRIALVSHELDYDSSLLKTVYQELVCLGILRFMVPIDQGGFGGGRLDWIEYNIKMAQYSGALLFLQAQHQFAVSQLKKLLPDKKAQDVLQSIVKNNNGLGIAIAANRKILQVKMHDNGFFVSGTLLWVTGHGFFPKIVFSFDYENTVYYTLLPFHPVKDSLTVSKNRETFVFGSTHSVSLTLHDYFIPKNEIIASEPFKLKIPVEHPAIYNFAGAALALLKMTMHEKYNVYPDTTIVRDRLLNEWHVYYKRIIQGNYDPFALRADGLQFAEKCLLFAKIVCGSNGLLSSHPVTRISREIWQYSMAGYSKDQFEAYLNIIYEVKNEAS